MGRPPTISRDQILATARRVFAAKGFEATTLADIATELKVTPAALLRHTQSKEALFRDAMTRPFELPDFMLRLADIDPTTDPRVVLRSIAENFIPFVKGVIAENIVVYMHEQSRPTLVVPFDRDSEDSSPRRGIRLLEGYFQRAAEAGVIRIADPRAAARLFIGALHSYVLLHHVINIPPYPVAHYIDALIDLWTHGGIIPSTGGTRARTRKKPNPRNRGDRSGRQRVDGGGVLPQGKTAAARDHPRRNAGGADGASGVARRRARRPGPRRCREIESRPAR